jgi:hypothetical protein
MNYEHSTDWGLLLTSSPFDFLQMSLSCQRIHASFKSIIEEIYFQVVENFLFPPNLLFPSSFLFLLLSFPPLFLLPLILSYPSSSSSSLPNPSSLYSPSTHCRIPFGKQIAIYSPHRQLCFLKTQFLPEQLN